MKSKIMLRVVALILIVVHFGSAGISLAWENCGTKLVVEAVRISGCLKQPCIFTSGQEYRLEVDAISVSSSKTLPYSVRASNVFEYEVSEGDACMHLNQGSSCPILKEGQAINFAKSFLIEFPALPTVRTFPAKVVAEMVDEYGVKLLCAKMEVEVRRRDNEFSFPFGLLDLWD